MQVRLWVALIIACLLMLSTSAIAGPKIPNWGDPDIVEGMRPTNPTPEDVTFDEVGATVTICPFRLPIMVIEKQEHPKESELSKKNLPAVYRFLGRADSR